VHALLHALVTPATALVTAGQDLPVAVGQDPQLAVLSGICVALAGVFHISSVGRERARHRLATLLGTQGHSLAPLRSAMEAKARGQAAAVYLILAGVAFSTSFLVQIGFGPAFLWWAAGALVGAGIAFLVFLEGYVSNGMRRLLLAHLRAHPYSFEDNIAMTREIGGLFGVASSPEDTLDTYLERLRAAVGIEESPSRLFRRPSASLHT